MQTKTAKALGLLDRLLASFQCALRSAEGSTEPIALIWTDADGEWRALFPVLRAVMPQIYSFGSYDPENHTGPAIWLKCVVDRTLPEVAPPVGDTPIIYLPGISRQELRAAGDCRPAYQPLIELQYRGRVWHQQNGRDWTVEAFLSSEDGLALDITRDNRTREAALRALPLLAEADLGSLRGHRLDADDFDKLAVHDPVRDLLRWMGNPDLFRKTLDGGRWQSFCNVCRSEFGINPDEDGPIVAASAIRAGDAAWERVWKRFCEAPKLYSGIPDLLREPSAGQGSLGFEQARNPLANDEAEERLRDALADLVSLPHHQACERVLLLEREHRERRAWVWAALGLSPYAEALAHLSRLADFARNPVAGISVQSIAEAYVAEGWRCDRAALEALANGKGTAEKTLIAKVVRALYSPWLEESARHFQTVVGKSGEELRAAVCGVVAERDTCILFVDGLRYDVATMVKDRLEARSFLTNISFRLAPIPTVTATAKPLVTPIAKDLIGIGAPDDFTPVLEASKQGATAARLCGEMEKLGIELLDSDEVRIPISAGHGGWTEMGRIDNLGHKLGLGLASQIEEQVESVADRVVALLHSGWRKVRVVTDHGWLLLPQELPKFELPPWVVQTKWARCAAVRGNSTPAVPTYGWYFNPDTQIASPPGIACFGAGNEYAHGGVSVQECVIPDLVIERGAEAVTATIAGVCWQRMRCRVTVKTNDPSLRVDLRLNYKKPETSVVAAVKEVGTRGEVSLFVDKDMYEGASAAVVVLNEKGDVLQSVQSRIGGEE